MPSDRDLSWFEEVVDAAVEELPDWVTERIDNLIVTVAEEPPADLANHDDDLLGLYDGVSLLERSEDYWGVLPDEITIFRRPHLRLGLDEEGLRKEVRKTFLHELAHHIGIEDDRLASLGWD